MDYKEKIKSLIEVYASSSLRAVVENKIISFTAKMLYRCLNRATESALAAFAHLREKFDKETNPQKKELKKVGLKLGSDCLKQIGQALINGSEILTENLGE